MGGVPARRPSAGTPPRHTAGVNVEVLTLRPQRILADNFSAIAALQQLKGQPRMYVEFEGKAAPFTDGKPAQSLSPQASNPRNVQAKIEQEFSRTGT